MHWCYTFQLRVTRAIQIVNIHELGATGSVISRSTCARPPASNTEVERREIQHDSVKPDFATQIQPIVDNKNKSTIPFERFILIVTKRIEYKL